jgi:PadR family transcriptional regulator, regulatory protein PadR
VEEVYPRTGRRCDRASSRRAPPLAAPLSTCGQVMVLACSETRIELPRQAGISARIRSALFDAAGARTTSYSIDREWRALVPVSITTLLCKAAYVSLGDLSAGRLDHRSHILFLTYLFRTTMVYSMRKKPEYRDLFPGALELMILKSLSWKPMHGYALAQRLKDISEDYLQIEEGSLYPALQRMLKAGWLKTEMGLSARNRPVRIFKVTQAGRKHLEQELASVEKMFAGVTRVLALAGQ